VLGVNAAANWVCLSALPSCPPAAEMYVGSTTQQAWSAEPMEMAMGIGVRKGCRVPSQVLIGYNPAGQWWYRTCPVHRFCW
jgi:hypothetical protein